MFSYIVRRLVAAVFLLLAVSFITFIIFFVVPRLAGASPDDLAGRYVGKTAGAEQIHARAVQMGFTDPLYVQYGSFVKGLFVGADYSTGASVDHCSAPCLGYSYQDQTPVLPDLLNRLPVTFSLAIGAAVIWLISGVSVGVLSALRRGSFFDRTAMSIALAGVSLPIFFTGLLSLSIFSYGLGWTKEGGSYTAFTDNPLNWAGALILPWITLAFLYAAGYARLTRAACSRPWARTTSGRRGPRACRNGPWSPSTPCAPR